MRERPIFSGPARRPRRSFRRRLDIPDHLADGLDSCSSFIGDDDAECLFRRHRQFDAIEAVGPKIVFQIRGRRHLASFDTDVLDDQFRHPLGYIAGLRKTPVDQQCCGGGAENSGCASA